MIDTCCDIIKMGEAIQLYSYAYLQLPARLVGFENPQLHVTSEPVN